MIAIAVALRIVGLVCFVAATAAPNRGLPQVTLIGAGLALWLFSILV